MQLAAILFDFDPTLEIAGIVVRWQTLANAAAIFLALALAAILAARTPALAISAPQPGRPPRPTRPTLEHLLTIACAAVPGAIVGGRIGYVLANFAYYTANPGDIANPSQGSLSLSASVAGAVVSATFVARAFGAPVDRWLHVATVPLLVAIAIGKIGMAAGGAGQGAPTDATWATAYLGARPWASLAPDLPAYPSQLLEAAATTAAMAMLIALLTLGRFRSRDGRAFAAAVCCWCVGRTLVGFTWRDEAVVGPFSPEQLVTLAVAAAALWIWVRGVPSRLTSHRPPPDATIGQTRAPVTAAAVSEETAAGALAPAATTHR